MVNSLKDAFERARRKLLEEPEGKAKEEPIVAEQRRRTTVVAPAEAESFASLLTPSQKRYKREESLNRVKVTYGSALPQTHRSGGSRPTPVSVVSGKRAVPQSTLRPANPVKSPPIASPAPPPAFTISVSKDAACAISRRDKHAAQLRSKVETAGRSVQVHASKLDDEREVVLGLDFGTSCVKVVIGDSALGKAFAVPFCNGDGIGRFLLPSRLCQTGRVFSLETGTHTYRDLKLSLLASPDDPILQRRVVAFLALIIRRARGWLLTEHAATYKRTGIAWKLAVGLPAAQHHQTPLSTLNRLIAPRQRARIVPKGAPQHNWPSPTLAVAAAPKPQRRVGPGGDAAQELLAGNGPRSEREEMRGLHLQSIRRTSRRRHSSTSRASATLEASRLRGEHRFPEEYAADRDPVEAASCPSCQVSTESAAPCRFSAT